MKQNHYNKCDCERGGEWPGVVYFLGICVLIVILAYWARPIEAHASWGEYTTASIDTVYQATDTKVMVYYMCRTSTVSAKTINLLSDSADPPTAVVASWAVSTGHGTDGVSWTRLIKEGDYFKTTNSGSCTDYQIYQYAVWINDVSAGGGSVEMDVTGIIEVLGSIAIILVFFVFIAAFLAFKEVFHIAN